MSDDRGNVKGRLYVFTDVSGSTDVLTGFGNWSYFKQNADTLADGVGYPLTVTVCDLNSLGVINDIHGR